MKKSMSFSDYGCVLCVNDLLNNTPYILKVSEDCKQDNDSRQDVAEYEIAGESGERQGSVNVHAKYTDFLESFPNRVRTEVNAEVEVTAVRKTPNIESIVSKLQELEKKSQEKSAAKFPKHLY